MKRILASILVALALVSAAAAQTFTGNSTPIFGKNATSGAIGVRIGTNSFQTIFTVDPTTNAVSLPTLVNQQTFTFDGIAIVIDTAAAPRVRFRSEAAGTDAKTWNIGANTAGSFVFTMFNDALSASTAWLTVTRTGYTAAAVLFPATDAVTIAGSLAVPTVATNDLSTSAASTALVGNKIASASGDFTCTTGVVCTVGAGAITSGKLATGAAATNLGAALGTSGATIPLNNSNNAVSGNNTYSGTNGFSVSPTVPTTATTDNSTKAASTAFVNAYVAANAVSTVSPAFTGTPTAPTASAATNTTQLATTQFVQTAIAPLAPTASPTFTGTVTSGAINASAAVSTTRINVGGGTLPTFTADVGTATPSTGYTDNQGKVTDTSSWTSVTITFGTAFTNPPSCTANLTATPGQISISTTTTQAVFTKNTASTLNMNYLCFGK